MIDLTRSGVSWLDVTKPPPPGTTWYVYLRTLQMEREHALAMNSRTHMEFGGRFVVFRFAYELAREVARDDSMWELVFRFMPPTDLEGWFPKRLFGCPCFRESRPGSIFVEYGGLKELVPQP